MDKDIESDNEARRLIRGKGKRDRTINKEGVLEYASGNAEVKCSARFL